MSRLHRPDLAPCLRAQLWNFLPLQSPDSTNDETIRMPGPVACLSGSHPRTIFVSYCFPAVCLFFITCINGYASSVSSPLACGMCPVMTGRPCFLVLLI